MNTLSFKDYYLKFGECRFLSAITTLGHNQNNWLDMKCKARRNSEQAYTLTITYPTLDETIELMSKVNKQVKNHSVPRPVRNKFYHKKHQFIRTLLELKKVSKIMETENLYDFIINDHSFHQPKRNFPNPRFTVDCTEEYVPREFNVPFNEEEYKLCLIGIATHMMY